MANKETKARRRERVAQILAALDQEYGTDTRCYLHYETPWQLLLAVIMSAQCTDARVNQVTEHLFRKYDSLEAFAGAESSLGTVMGSVFPATMPSNVARSFSGVIFAMLEQALERRASTRMRPSCSRARRSTRLISVPT